MHDSYSVCTACIYTVIIMHEMLGVMMCTVGDHMSTNWNRHCNMGNLHGQHGTFGGKVDLEFREHATLWEKQMSCTSHPNR